MPLHVGAKKIACTECHTSPDAAPTETACAKCHERETGTHHRGGGRSPTTCLSCHAFGAAQPAATCNECHSNATRRRARRTRPRSIIMRAPICPAGLATACTGRIERCSPTARPATRARAPRTEASRPTRPLRASMRRWISRSTRRCLRSSAKQARRSVCTPRRRSRLRSIHARPRQARSARCATPRTPARRRLAARARDVMSEPTTAPRALFPGARRSVCVRRSREDSAARRASRRAGRRSRGVRDVSRAASRTSRRRSCLRGLPRGSSRRERGGGTRCVHGLSHAARAGGGEVVVHGELPLERHGHRRAARCGARRVLELPRSPSSERVGRTGMRSLPREHEAVASSDRFGEGRAGVHRMPCAARRSWRPDGDDVTRGGACRSPWLVVARPAFGGPAPTEDRSPVQHGGAMHLVPHEREGGPRAPRQGTACTSCHAPHAFRLAGSGARLCAGCHAEKAKATSVRPGHASCNACHGTAHAPVAKPSCSGCHAEEAKTAHAGHATCTSCHDAHSGSLGSHASCTSCHENKAKALHANAAQGCTTCHRAHGPKGVERPAACASCHARPSLKGLHSVAAHAQCETCHSAHAPPRSDRATCTGSCHADKRSHQPEAKLCKGCHLFRH